MALAKAAAMQAAKDAKEKADKEVAEMELSRLRDTFKVEQDRVMSDMDNAKSAQQIKLQQKLAQKKAAKEAELRNKEEAMKRDLAQKQKEQVEKLQEALALETISDDVAIKAAISEQMSIARDQNLAGYNREIFVMEKILAKFAIPAAKMRLFVEMVMEERHSQELGELLGNQYKTRSATLREAFNNLFDRKATDRQKQIDRLIAKGASENDRLEAMSMLDAKYAEEQHQIEGKVMAERDAELVDAQLKLRQKQSTEIVGAVKQLLPDNANKELARLDAEQEDIRLQYQKEKEARLNKMQEDKARFEEELKKRREEELARMEKENEEILRKAKERQERELKEHQELLIKQREELERKAKDETGVLHKDTKDQLMKKFQEDQKKDTDAFEARRAAERKALQDKIKKRKEQKTRQLDSEISTQEALVTQKMEAIQSLTDTGDDFMKTTVMEIPNELKAMAQKTLEGAQQTVILDFNADPSTRRNERLLQAKKGNVELGAPEAIAPGMNRMEVKLHAIEKLLTALQVAQERTEKGMSELRGGGRAGISLGYQDADDAATTSSVKEVQELQKDELPPQAGPRIEFAEHILKSLGVSDLKVCIAKAIPASSLTDNAFKNSFFYDADHKKLFIHAKRLQNSGDFSLVLIHAVSHIKV